MSRIYSLYLQDVVEAAERIASYVENVSQSEFEMDQMRIDAVIRNLQIIGEAVKKKIQIQSEKVIQKLHGRKLQALETE